jgi:hypothetical protein
VFLHLLLGFRELGWDVHFIDRLEPGMCVDGAGAPTSFAGSANVSYLDAVMREFGLEDCWTLLGSAWGEVAGAPRERARECLRRSRMVIDVMGFLEDEELLAAAPCRVFLDIDPGFGQMWSDLGLHDLFAGYDRFVTVGTNVGHPGCDVPTCGLDWITMLPPVVLDLWSATAPPGPAYTSVVTWRGPFAPIVHHGTTYGLRVHEFRRFLELPELTPAAFELALDIDPSDAADTVRLLEHGWRLVDPTVVAADPSGYRRYLQMSRGELMVAKHLYVATRSGWFSDRSACYLAAGRPVIAQDTGLCDRLPIGTGLLTFDTIDEAADAVMAVEGDWVRHAAAARGVAEECFAAKAVLGGLVERLGVV